MTEEERKKYLEAYYDNEADANKQMSFANAFAAFVMLLMWIAYITGFFPVKEFVLVLINIIFPVSIFILLTPLFYVFFKPEVLRKPRYKYFVVFSFVSVIAAINIIVPKHGVIGWALCIVMTNHFYNTKLCKATYFVVMVLLLLCLYAGMFFGEYDPNLLGSGKVIDGENVFVNGVQERYEMLHEMLLEGENRYLKVFLYYYISRGVLLSLIYFVSNALNKRTYKLLVSEITVNSEQEKTKTELEVAKEIQLASLPVEFVTNEDIEIQAELKAAKTVGGDFYDYYVLDDEHVALLIADVSGKGIPAAMFMMKTITCFKNYILPHKKPSEILKEVNRSIYKNNESNMFVTCFLAIINTNNGEVVFANAGHNPPLVGQNQKYRFLACKPGFILGGLPEAFVEDETFTLNNGDMLTLYTDGITEARNDKGEFYGEDRLLKIFNEKKYSCLIELHHVLKDDIARFTNNADQSDDMTYITLKYHGEKYFFKEKLYKADLDLIPEMLEFLKEFSNTYNFPEDFVSNLMIVGDEMLSNIAKYAYIDKEEGNIFMRLLYSVDRKEFILTIIDNGEEFNPFTTNNKPLEGDVSNIKVGGLGILIVKKLMSEYAYDRINGKNIVILKKTFK